MNRVVELASFMKLVYVLAAGVNITANTGRIRMTVKHGNLDMKRRMIAMKTTKPPKQPKIASCGFVPGKACFTCPLRDCMDKGTAQSPDERVMSRCGRFIPPPEAVQRERVFYDPRKHRRNSGYDYQQKMGNVKQRSKQWIESNLQKRYGRKLAPVVASLANRKRRIHRSVSTVELSNNVSFGEMNHEG